MRGVGGVLAHVDAAPCYHLRAQLLARNTWLMACLQLHPVEHVQVEGRGSPCMDRQQWRPQHQCDKRSEEGNPNPQQAACAAEGGV
jgi:hypothetical protein